jgi:hypothetical protein
LPQRFPEILVDFQQGRTFESRLGRIENRRTDRQQVIEEQRTQDAALQAYIDELSYLLLEKNLRGSAQRTRC